MLHKKVGDRVEADEAFATLHVNDEKKVAEVQQRLQAAYELSDAVPPKHPLVYGVVTKQGTERFV